MRCSGVARKSFAYHARGTLILRPSRRETLSESSEKPTTVTRSSAERAKLPMPCPQKLLLMLSHQVLYPLLFHRPIRSRVGELRMDSQKA